MNRLALITIGLVTSNGFALAQVSFEGHLLGAHGEPLHNVEIWVQREPYTEKADFRPHTDLNGRFVLANVPTGKYSVSVVRINGVDDFVASHIQTRVGDKWVMKYSIQRRLVTIRNEATNFVRRFEYLGSRGKLLAEGNWTETTNGLPKWVRECAELRSHPTIRSRDGVVLCAKHRIPLITQRAYERADRYVTLIETWGLQRRREECNPNYIPTGVSLRRDKKYTIPTTVTYCPKCEDATWLTEEENRRNLNGDYRQ